MPEAPVVVIAGGFLAVKPGASLYYHILCRLTGGHLVTLDGAGLGPSDDIYRHFEAEVDKLSAGGKPLIIIGHSLGVIQAIRYAASHDNVLWIVGLGAPMEGSALCHVARPLVSLIGRFVPRLAQVEVLSDLTPKSAYLDEISELLPLVVDRLTCVHTRLDLVVWPAKSCYVVGAHDYLYLPWANHLTMIIHPAVITKAVEIIKQAWQSSAPEPRVLATAASL